MSNIICMCIELPTHTLGVTHAEKDFPARKNAGKAIQRNFHDIHRAEFKRLSLFPFRLEGNKNKGRKEISRNILFEKIKIEFTT